jgi:arsenate reductase
MKKRVIFVCIHNSARSQMAEAFLNRICGDEFEVHSAGLEPGRLNPVVVEAMAELGYDLAANPTKGVEGYLRKGTWFQYVITVCDEASAEKCPIFPGVSKRMHWSFPDPSSFKGTPAEKLAATREVRDLIRTRVEEFCAAECVAV